MIRSVELTIASIRADRRNGGHNRGTDRFACDVRAKEAARADPRAGHGRPPYSDILGTRALPSLRRPVIESDAQVPDSFETPLRNDGRGHLRAAARASETFSQGPQVESRAIASGASVEAAAAMRKG